MSSESCNKKIITYSKKAAQRNAERIHLELPKSDSIFSPVSSDPPPVAALEAETKSKQGSLYAYLQRLPPSAGVKRKMDCVVSPKHQSSAKGKLVQLHLDIGQNDAFIATCKICGMHYSRGVASDEITHRKFHDIFVHGVEWTTAADIPGNGKMNSYSFALVSCHSPNARLAKVHDILEYASKELGLATHLRSLAAHQGAVLALHSTGGATSRKHVIGILVVELIRNAALVKFDNLAGNSVECASPIRGSELESLASSSESTATKKISHENLLGVAVVWVHANHRRKGLAQSLISIACSQPTGLFFQFIGCTSKHVAFLAPTDDGARFASNLRGDGYVLKYSSYEDALVSSIATEDDD